MKDESKLSAAISKALNAALLLTNNTLRAEQAVSSAIESLGPEEFNLAAFLSRTVQSAIAYGRRHEDRKTAGAADDCWLELPLELRNVLQLKTAPRRCFVLRVLLGFPVEHCARLLHMESLDVRARTVEAMQSLARLASAKVSAPAPFRDRFPESTESLKLAWGFRWTQSQEQ